jgi:hypothetical protein
VKKIVAVFALIIFASVFAESSYAADKTVPAEEAVSRIETWLKGASDGFGIGGDKVRTVIEYDYVYFMILSPSGWLVTPKNDENFGPHSFGEGRADKEGFEKSLWGEMAGAKGGVVVYENPDADKPRQRIYRGLDDMPYDNKIEADKREYWRDGGENVYTYEGTASNDVFIIGLTPNFHRDKNTYVMAGNGGNDIYDCSNLTAAKVIRIDRKNSDDRNIVLTGYYELGHGAGNELIPLRDGSDLILAFVRNMNASIRIENWYLGPRHRPDMIISDAEGSWDAEAIEKIASEAKMIETVIRP